MIFPHPVSLEEAMQTRMAKGILPTTMSSRMLHELPRQVWERAIFSAGVQNVDFLEEARQAIDSIVAGEVNKATERTILRQLAEKFSMEGLTKEPRLNLILDTQVKMANGFGTWVEGQHPSVLMQWPCQEFYRAEERKEPRDWPTRWEEVGGDFYPGDADYPEGRMIALKNDPIWEALSAFGLPYAPFDYNSGMDLRDIDREEAIELGILDEDETIEPEEMGLNEGLEAHIGEAAEFGLGVRLGEFLVGIAKVGVDGLVKFIGAGS